MSHLITATTIGKNDGFGGAYAIEKIAYCVKKNHTLMVEAGIDHDYVFVDWGSQESKMMCNEKLLADIPYLRFIYVTQSVIAKEGFNPDGMLEFYAKNVAIRNSQSPYTLLLNDDIYFTPAIAQKINAVTQWGQKNFWARPTYKISHDYNLEEDFTNMVIREEYPVIRPSELPSEGSAGDILLADTDVLKRAQGFTEVDARPKWENKQLHCDRGFCRKMIFQGVTPILWDEKYYHLHHHHGYTVEKPPTEYPIELLGSDHAGYTNPAGWGCGNYQQEVVNEKLTLIKT
jgi:hypothetical protein